MGFNIKNNYGPNIEVKDGGRLTLVQGKDGLWHTADVVEADYEEVVEEVFVPRQLQFFDMVTLGSEEKQPKLIAMLRDVATQIDTTSGRGWFCIYAGYRYFKQQLAVMGDYTDFFADIEALMPDLLTKIDKDEEGEARYHNYTVLMGREAALWYMDKGKLPPLNEITVWKDRFKGDKNRYSTHTPIIIDVYKRLKTI
jgi:hypothetical protein